ncbi:HEAT repeat domain-containing protein [Streptomyces sp. NPDC091268]|uniref:HEAT repeat domain-containing protein n=1 Tax=Streptomyces sp. NPDC091268 TaxID=3365979 RepID=UPI0038255C38
MSGAVESPLIAAARAGDVVQAKRILEEDGDHRDYDALAAAFGAAVRAFRGNVAQVLLRCGADAGQCAPDELPSLREAVDSGSPALVEALLDYSIRDRYAESELLEMRDLARSWYESGVEAELRRRTGSRGALVRTRVEDDDNYTVGEFALDGMTVRDGHGAILTTLEELLGIRTSCDELMARALAQDQDHAAWGRAAIVLSHRRDQETWTAAATLRTHTDPSRRLFGAELMRLTELFADGHEEEFSVLAVDALTEWAAEETDSAVLTMVLHGLDSYQGPRAEAALLAHAGHLDAGVRRAVASGLGRSVPPRSLTDEAREALLALMADVDTDVRLAACSKAGEIMNGDPAVTNAMAALLPHPERRVRLAAVYGLALHEDERCVEEAERLGPPRPGFHDEEAGYLDVAWRFMRRRDGIGRRSESDAKCPGAGDAARFT